MISMLVELRVNDSIYLPTVQEKDIGTKEMNY